MMIEFEGSIKHGANPLRSRRDPALEKANTILKSEAAPEAAAALLFKSTIRSLKEKASDEHPGHLDGQSAGAQCFK